MNPNSSGSLIDRIIAWLRGFFAAGRSATDSATREVRRSAHQATDTVREGVDDAERKVRDMADRRGADTASAGARDRQGLPDLADEPSGGGRSTFGVAASDTTSTPRDVAASYRSDTGDLEDMSDEEIDRRSDFDDAAGDWETGAETYPQAGTDISAATHVHDAVGGEDERADDTTDGMIDTTRDADLRPGGTEGYQDREIPLQDDLIVDEGASSEEFDGDEVTPGDADNPYVTREDVESAAEGYGDSDNTDLANTSAQGTSTLTGSTFTETDVDVPPSSEGDTSDLEQAGQQADADAGDRSGDFHVVERYNYGMGDLGVGAGATPDDAWDDTAGPEVTTSDIDAGAASSKETGTSGDAGLSDVEMDASVSPDATRTEIESQSRGDAVNRSDEATQTPGFGEAETFGDAATGTTAPSRSATGNDLDQGQDALGTTLDHEAESSEFSEEAANLADQAELAVSDTNVDERAADAGVERVTTFQSGTIAHEEFVSEDAGIDEEVTAAAYADLPNEPDHETADDAGVDDFSGSDYPSDRRVDTLAGDDFTDAEVPDVPDLDSSAGDLDAVSTDATAELDAMTEPVVEGTVGDAGQYLDQDLVGTSDEHVGGEEPEFAEMASRGTDETSVDDLNPEARAVDDTLAAGIGGTDDAVAETFATDDITGGGDLGGGPEGMTDTEVAPELGGMGISDAGTSEIDETVAAGAASQASAAGGGRPVPAGSVRGDGGTDAPAGYPIKGNANSMIYHLPEFPSYSGTKAEFYFATEEDAIAAGYRAPGNVRRGEAAAASAASGAGVTGDETAHVAPGEVAFDERLSNDRGDEGGVSSGASLDASATDADIPAGAVRGDGTAETPEGYPVKGNASSMIYHLPSFPSYKSTKAEFCFATEQDALNAGYRAPGKRNRGRKS